MKKIVLIMVMTAFVLCLVFTGCQGSADNDTHEAVEIEAESTIEETPDEDAVQQDTQEDVVNQQALEYLSLLGLDETCSYTIADTFPSGVEGKEMYLITVTNITEEDFAAIEGALHTNGFAVVSDIYTNEDAMTRSYPYSNNESLYIEIVFSYGAEYFDITFTPIA